MSLAAAKEISMNAAAAAVVSELDDIFTLEEGFSQQTACFHFTPGWLWQEFSKKFGSVHLNLTEDVSPRTLSVLSLRN